VPPIAAALLSARLKKENEAMSTLNYKPINPAFNACVQTICKSVWPQSFDVSENAPSNFEELKADFAKRGRIAVWSGGSEHTIFGEPDINYMFRAWHDWCHLHGNHDFTVEGERNAALMQCEHIRQRYGDGETAAEFCKLVMEEVCGQAEYQKARGHFPNDQVAFARAYLDNPIAAMAAEF
jgi:hypothetical protein